MWEYTEVPFGVGTSILWGIGATHEGTFLATRTSQKDPEPKRQLNSFYDSGGYVKLVSNALVSSLHGILLILCTIVLALINLRDTCTGDESWHGNQLPWW